MIRRRRLLRDEESFSWSSGWRWPYSSGTATPGRFDRPAVPGSHDEVPAILLIRGDSETAVPADAARGQIQGQVTGRAASQWLPGVGFH